MPEGRSALLPRQAAVTMRRSTTVTARPWAATPPEGATGGVSDQEEDVAAAFVPLPELPELDELLVEFEEPALLDVLDEDELLSVDFEELESDFFSEAEPDSDFTVEVAPSPLPLRLSVR